MNVVTRDALQIVDRWIERRHQRSHTPGWAVGIVEDGEVRLVRGYGHGDLVRRDDVDGDTKFRLASITKTFLAVAVMQLVEAGLISLDDPISNHLDWVRSKQDPRVEAITIRQAATHTAGLAREGQIRFDADGYWPNNDEARAAIESSIVIPPNSRLAYSNYGFYLLGELVQQVSGQPFHAYLRDHLLAPLTMTRTSCEPDDQTFDGLATGYLAENVNGQHEQAQLERLDAFAPVGGAVSTAADMTRYMQFLIDGDTTVLSDDLRHEMIRTQWYQPDGPVRWGIGFHHRDIERRDVAGHTGLLLGFRPQFGVDLERRRGVVVLTNAIDAPTAAVLEATFKALEKMKLGSFGSGAANRERAERYCGEFYSNWGPFAISCLGDALIGWDTDADDVISEPDILEVLNDRELQIVDGSFGSHVGQTVLYDFDENGKATHVHYGSYAAERINA